MRRLNMPGGSSAAKEEPTKASSPPPLLGAAGGTKGGASQDDHIDGPFMEPPRVSPAPPLLLKERAHGRSTVY